MDNLKRMSAHDGHEGPTAASLARPAPDGLAPASLSHPVSECAAVQLPAPAPQLPQQPRGEGAEQHGRVPGKLVSTMQATWEEYYAKGSPALRARAAAEGYSPAPPVPPRPAHQALAAANAHLEPARAAALEAMLAAAARERQQQLAPPPAAPAAAAASVPGGGGPAAMMGAFQQEIGNDVWLPAAVAPSVPAASGSGSLRPLGPSPGSMRSNGSGSSGGSERTEGSKQSRRSSSRRSSSCRSFGPESGIPGPEAGGSTSPAPLVSHGRGSGSASRGGRSISHAGGRSSSISSSASSAEPDRRGGSPCRCSSGHGSMGSGRAAWHELQGVDKSDYWQGREGCDGDDAGEGSSSSYETEGASHEGQGDATEGSSLSYEGASQGGQGDEGRGSLTAWPPLSGRGSGGSGGTCSSSNAPSSSVRSRSARHSCGQVFQAGTSSPSRGPGHAGSLAAAEAPRGIYSASVGVPVTFGPASVQPAQASPSTAWLETAPQQPGGQAGEE